MQPNILWNMVSVYLEWLPLRHVKDFIIGYSGTGLLHGIVSAVPYGDAPYGTLQD